MSWLHGSRIIGCAAFYPLIYVRDIHDVSTVNHETIHFVQMQDESPIVYLIRYFHYYFQNQAKGQSGFDSYYNIPYEQEAYWNEANLNYLQTRSKLSYKKYLTK